MGMTVYMLRNNDLNQYWRNGSHWVSQERGQVWNSKNGPYGAKSQVTKMYQDTVHRARRKGEEPPEKPNTEVVRFEMKEMA